MKYGKREILFHAESIDNPFRSSVGRNKAELQSLNIADGLPIDASGWHTNFATKFNSRRASNGVGNFFAPRSR